MCTFSIATSESWRDKSSGERKEKTEWHRIAIYNDRLVEVAENTMRKGSKVYVEGALETRKWTDKDGLVAISRSKEMVELLGASGASVFLSNNRKHKEREYPWETMERHGADPEAIKAVITLHDEKEAEIFHECGVDLPVILPDF